MSAEINKILCAILSSILVLLLSSFIGELLYHPDTYVEKVSYLAASSEDNKENLEDKDISKEKGEEEGETISAEKIKSLMQLASLENGEKFVTKNCSACHSFTLPIKNKIGPSLANVVNRNVGSIEGYNYSKSFKTIDKDWSYENLYLFLQKPKTWAPGTKMSYRGISNGEDLVNTLKYLSHISKLNEG